MSIAPRPPIPELIPESAPFTLEQRTWLNGFFAGLLSLDGAGIKPLSPAESAALVTSRTRNARGCTVGDSYMSTSPSYTS